MEKRNLECKFKIMKKSKRILCNLVGGNDVLGPKNHKI